MKIKRMICLVLALVLVTAIAPVSAGAAVSTVNVSDHGIGDLQRAADSDGKDAKADVTYFDPVSGEEKTCSNYTAVTSTTKEFGSGWYVAEGSVTVNSRITVTGSATLILKDGATLTAAQGINVGSGRKLTIYGQTEDTGKLFAGGAAKQAGIGGNNHEDCGIIVINGGDIKAQGGRYGAGIGGGNCGKGGNITINGGSVTATGGSEGAGIGGGDEDPGEYVLITGGNVTATGGEWAAGIGGGGMHGADPGGPVSSSNYGGSSGTVVIKGGNVTAIGGDRAAGIGGGNHADCNDITIEDGVVTAYCSGKWGAGIGGGNCGSGGAVVITGGIIEVTAGSSSGSEKPFAVGRGDEGARTGSIALYRGMRVYVSGTPIDINDRVYACRTEGNTTVRIEFCREHQIDSVMCQWCGAIKPAVSLDRTLKPGVNTDNAATVYYAGSAWRVIGADGEGVASKADVLTLISAGAMGSCQFKKNTASETFNNEYSSSLLKKKVDALAHRLSSAERAAAVEKTLVSGTYDNFTFVDCIAGPEVQNAILWPLSPGEANGMNRSLLMIDPEHPSWASSIWWLRSPGYLNNYASYVNSLGGIERLGGIVEREYSIRPALNLDRTYVLFATAAEGGKTGTLGKMSKVEENKSNEWKLTVYDREREGFSAGFVDFENRILTIKYSDAKTGDNEMISAILVNKYGTLKYYAQLGAAQEGKNITLTCDLNVTLRDGDIFYVFNEKCNGDKATDYASALIRIMHFEINEPLYGDCNNDGTVNGQDLVRLRKALVGYDVQIFRGADVNGDGVIDGRDLIRLRKYLLTEDPEILGPA